MDVTKYIPNDPEGVIWDVVVIGSGAGGGTAGFNLARLGRSVLFLERGKHSESGWWPHSVSRKGSFNGEAPVSIGCGVGGSTALFGMVMDRFRPADFKRRSFADALPDASSPIAWPIEYAELEPYYREAESLFRVRGTDDPLTPTGGPLLEPGPPSEVETVLYETLREVGLHPYGLHTACERVAGCDGCFGRPCPQSCRNDAARICVLPALEHHGAQLITDCRVVRLETKGRTVHQAVCVWRGRPITVRARVFVLALHALLTPALLLRSANNSYPDGLGNSSGMVGRNLMCHVMDSILVRFDNLHGPLNGLLNHGLALNNFYTHNGLKLGNIQAHAANFERLYGENDTASTAHFFTILEDLPYATNRVTPKPGGDDGVFWEYRHREELEFRRKMLVNAFVTALSARRNVAIETRFNDIGAPHACGTCRFGDDPRTSVLDRENRIHDLDNAYVVDASFFPSSGGMNPSLTIVANSLRVSALISKR